MTDAELTALEAADAVVLTEHAQEKDVDPAAVQALVADLAGAVYLDTAKGTLHVVSDELSAVVDVRDGARVVITAFRHADAPKYQLDRFRLLRG